MLLSFKKASRKGAFFVCLFAFIFCLTSQRLPAESCQSHHIDEYVTVGYIYDGDTVRLKDGRKVRIIGIDAPEIARGDKRAEPYADKARETIQQIIGEEKQLGLVFGQEKRDKYGRWLAHVYNDKGNNVSAELLKQGLAHLMIIPPNLQFAPCYSRQESLARKRHVGIWGLAKYQAVSAQKLVGNTHAYRVITGRITQIKYTKSSVLLSLGSKLVVRIPHEDKQRFSSLDINGLLNKSVTVRGTVYRTKQGLTMHLRHPYAMELGN